MDIYDVPAKGGRFNKKSLLKYLLILVAIAAVITVFLVIHSPKKKSPTTTNTTNTSSVAQITVPNPTQQYFSNNLGLGFNYPNNWKVVDTVGSNQIIVTSTPQKLENASGQTVTGEIILTVNDTNPTNLSQFSKGSAVEALKSQLINYTNPTANQKQSTYISFLHYASSVTPATSIDGVYITGNSGYQVAQNVPQTDILAVNPIVSLSFVSCSDSSCSSTTQLSLSSALWSEKSFSGPLLSMLESLAFS